MPKVGLPLLYLCLALLLAACHNTPQGADTIIINGIIATMDKGNPQAQAIAIKGGRILAVGDNDAIQALRHDSTQVLDARGRFVMPGFIEGHAHLSYMGKGLLKLNLLKTKNWEEIVALVAEKAKTARPGEWIEGRGWHQEKWDTPLARHVDGYPYHDLLSQVSPDNPVILRHASGHSVFANKKAMEAAGITPETADPAGGRILRGQDKAAIGVFEERAMDAIYDAYDEYLAQLDPAALEQEWMDGHRLAEQECLRNGITSFQDAGVSYEEIERYKKLAEAGELNIRIWGMLRHPYEEMAGNMQGLPLKNAGGGFFTCAAVKSQVDGALGAYGAWLLKAYNDKAGFTGQNTTTLEEVRNIAGLCAKHDMQLCVHAIGDRANREVLGIYEEAFAKNDGKDWRWRIEHAQHVNEEDIPRFAQSRIIASMQGIHCTSDAPFVSKRLGQVRAKRDSYPWRSLLDAGALIANGTDAPVEDVNPIECFYASVTRKRADNGMEFFPEQAMTRQEALESYTINNAYAAFEEGDKGSLEVGKLADIVILSQNLLTIPDEGILSTEVVCTIVGGKVGHGGVD